MLDKDEYEVSGSIDLVIKEDNNHISIIKFITSTENISIDEYLRNCAFYGTLIKNNGNYDDYLVKNIIVHSIADKNQFSLEFKEKYINEIENIFENIIKNQFTESNNCDKCEFSNVICKTNNETNIQFKNKFLDLTNELISELKSNTPENYNNYDLTKQGVYYLYDYVPFDKKDFYDSKISDEILMYKSGILTYVKKFTLDLIDFILYLSDILSDSSVDKIYLVSVPSSTLNRNKYSSIKKSIRLIEHINNEDLINFNEGCQKQIINLNDLLIRTKDVFTAHKSSGPRPSYNDHINSIEFNQEKLNDLNNAIFILLDDITTTGTIMNACGDILVNNGIKEENIYKFAFGKTVWD